jgi:phage baseplate assembly protein W
MATYKGFNTQGQSKKFRITDADLIKRDLMNHFSIRKGEKLMQPNFGSIIWGMLFEPLTNEVKAEIVKDITTIINYDPRVNVESVDVTQYDHGIQVAVGLTYINNNQSDLLYMNFNGNSQRLSFS